MKTLSITCDICGEGAINEYKSLQVIFTTEQDEGRPCKPYLDTARIDLCNECNKILLNGNYVFAQGAMSHNKFYFKK